MPKLVSGGPSNLPRPTQEEAQALAHDMLHDQGTRWEHVRTAGSVAARLRHLFELEEAALLVAAATLHDIGYSARVVRTGFHSLDGALFLRAEGYPERLARLVAHHSWAVVTAPQNGVHDLEYQFRREDSLLADALVYSDMHSAPSGEFIEPEARLADIARRHANPVLHTARAGMLRASIARVSSALDDSPPPEE